MAGEGYPLRLANPHQEWVYWWYCAGSDVFTDGLTNVYGVCRSVIPHRYLPCCWRLRTVDWDDVTNELAVDTHLEAQYDESQGEGT